MATQNSSNIKNAGLVSCDGSGGFDGRTITQPAAGITVANADGVSGNPTIALADDLAALEGMSGTGLVSRTASNTYEQRTLGGTTDFIDIANGDGVSGAPTVSVATKFETTGMHGWNGAFLEKASTTVTSDGATITLSIQKSGGGDLTLVFSDGYYAYDTTPADTVTLTAGTDAVPVLNYIYIPQSTKTLTASTTEWSSSAESAKVAEVLCQSAASLQTQGPYKHHQWTDDVREASEQGHITDLTYWIRRQNATWLEGVNQTYTITPNVGTPDNVILTTAVGEVLQLHENTFPAFTGTPDIYVINDSGTAYTVVNDLADLLTDSTGASMSGRYFSLVLWGAVNQNTGDCKIFCNLPSGSYSNETTLLQDASRYANYNIPLAYKGVGFLISEWKLRHQAASGGTFTSVSEIDLRGFIPNTLAGGGNASVTEFIDSSFRVADDLDITKELAFQCSGITTGTTRTLTIPDANGTIALTGVSGFGTGASSFTTYGPVVAGATSTTALSSVAPSATTGIPFVSQGSSANPAFGTAVVAGGGTGATTLTGVLTGNGTSAVTANTVTQYGVVTAGASNAVTSTAALTDGQLVVGSTSAAPILMPPQWMPVHNGYVWNLGLTLSAGTITLTSADGTALSSTNPAFAVLRDKTNKALSKTYKITANQSFSDSSSGGSEIIGNLFGLPTGVAYTVDRPFFIYLVANDDEDTLQAMLSDNPSAVRTVAASKIGAPDDPVANAQGDFWSWDNIDETLYDDNPCLNIGCIRMTMNASDDWAILAFTEQGGIGRYQEMTYFTLPRGSFGAAANSYFNATANTEPTSPEPTAMSYRLDLGGTVQVRANFTINNTPTGADESQIILPYISGVYSTADAYWVDGGTTKLFRAQSGGAASRFLQNMQIDGGTTDLKNQDFANGDTVVFTYTYRPFLTNAS